MKLIFTFKELPTKPYHTQYPGCDNIPMISIEGYLWFIWDKENIQSESTSFKYVLKKL